MEDRPASQKAVYLFPTWHYGGDIRNPASLHRYRYASGNPVNRVDSSGRADTSELVIGLGWTTFQAGVGVYVLGKSINCLYESEASAVRLINGPQTGAVFEQLVSIRLDQAGCLANAVFSAWGLGGIAYGGLASLLADTEPGAIESALPAMGDCCFAAGTLVHTYHGDVTIERIRAGDMVLSRNRTTGKQEYKRVTALTAQHRDKLIELRVEGEPEPLRPSINHPFWVLRGPSQQAAWIVADSMRVGDLVLDLKGEWRKVLSVKTLEGMQTVYNFEVDDNHDYFVGTTGLLVHNSFCPLFHGTDLESAFDIAEHGIETEATDFFMSSSQGEAEYYAKYNPAGGEPALVSITLPDSVAAKLEAAGDLQIINNSTYRFLPGAWQILNDLGFNLVPGK